MAPGGTGTEDKDVAPGGIGTEDGEEPASDGTG